MPGITKQIVAKLHLDGKEFNSAAGTAKKSITALAASVTAVGAAIMVATKMTANYRDETTKMARAAGSTVEEFSALRYAADLSGISMENLAKGLRKITEPMPLASRELEKLGVKLKDASGQTRNQSVILSELADKFKDMKNPAQKAGSAMLIFGERGAEMVNLLAGGSEGIKKMTDEAITMGIVFDERAGVAAELFNDNITRMTTSIKGLVHQVTGSIIEFINQTGIMKALSSAVQSVTAWWMNLDDSTKDMITTIGGVVTAVAALTLAFIGFAAIAPMIGTAITAAMGGLNLIVIAIAAVIAAVVAMSVAVIKYWGQIKTAIDPVIEVIKSFKNEIQQALAPIIKTFSSVIGAIRKYVGEIVEKMKDWLGITEDSSTEISILGTVAKTIFAVIATAVMVMILPFKVLYKLISSVVLALRGMGEAAWEALKGNMDAAARLAKAQGKRLSDMASSIKKDFVDTGKAIKKTFANLTVKIDPTEAIKNINGIKDAVSAIQEASTKTKKKVEKTFKEMAKGTVSDFSKIVGGVTNIMGAAVKLIEMGIGKAIATINRRMDYFIEKYAQLKEEEIELTEKAENEKMELLKNKYDAQLASLTANEKSKIDIMKNASSMRLLALDEEYKSVAKKQEEEFERFMESEAIRYEAEKELILIKATDKEQRMLVEAILDQDQKNYTANQQKLHDEKMAQFASDYITKKTIEDDESKQQLVNAETELKDKISALTEEKNTALTTAEEEKNEKLNALEEKKTADEKKQKKIQTLLNWQAQKAQLEQTKGMQISSTIIAGIAGAASAFAMAAGSIPIAGIIIGAVLMATVLATTFASVAQIAGQTAPPPVSLFLASGGLLKGPKHSQGGVNASLEGGEMVIDRLRSQQFLNALDKQTTKNNDINIIFETGSIQNYGDPLDETFMDKLSYKISGRLERIGVSA